MNFNNYLLALVAYALNEVRVYIAETTVEINDSDDYGDRKIMEAIRAEELRLEREWEGHMSRLIECHETAERAIVADRSRLLDLWDYARDGFKESPQAAKIAQCDEKILGEGYKDLAVLVAENI